MTENAAVIKKKQKSRKTTQLDYCMCDTGKKVKM